ncbi:MAG: hypothetical protein OEZ13_08315 [Spirochaetia bacterium]|nr:hypothetical protein [Spirochaetia bacterium]
MEFIVTSSVVIHIVSGLFWGSGTLFLAFIMYPVLKKYGEYMYFINYKIELMQKYIKALNISLVLSTISGALLVLFNKKMDIEKYIFFSIKMVFLIFSFFLAYPYMRYKHADEQVERQDIFKQKDQNVPSNTRAILLLICIISMVFISVLIRRKF